MSGDTGHGRVVDVTPVRLGDELAADAAVGTAVLKVYDVSDFDEDGGWLQLGSKRLAYTRTDADTEQVFLAANLTTAGLLGDRVESWSGPAPDGRVDIEWEVSFVLDDQDSGDVLTGGLSHTLRDRLAEGVRDRLLGESIEWEVDDEDDLRIVDIYGRTPSVDSDYTETPNATGQHPGAQWPTGQWVTLRNWSARLVDGITYDNATGIWWFSRPGLYLAVFGAGFNSNSSGGRAVRHVLHYADGTSFEATLAPSTPPRVGDPTALQTTVLQVFNTGDGLSFQAYQDSGAVLPLRSATNVSIARVAT